MIKPFKYTFLLITIGQSLCAQVYLEKQSRHRFAQLNLGLDYEMTLPSDLILNASTSRLNPAFTPRIMIGGTHFWGHADFVVAIPLRRNEQEIDGSVFSYRRGVETQFKYYPWRIEHGKLRPYLGVALASFSWRQSGSNSSAEGPNYHYLTTPLHLGLSYNYRSWLWELSYSYSFTKSHQYWNSPIGQVEQNLPNSFLGFSMRYMLETTLSAEASWEDGSAEALTQKLAERKLLDGFFIGAGFSSAFWSREDANQRFPFFGSFANSTMPEWSLGYYFHQPDINLNLAYRSYHQSDRAFNYSQAAGRRSLAFEAHKALFDYNGFVPFVGPFLSWENLSYQSTFRGSPIDDVSQNLFAYGLTFGWDIRPNRIQGFILRTNLRWTPNLNLQIAEGAIMNYSAIEFNFIQLILFPGRMF